MRKKTGELARAAGARIERARAARARIERARAAAPHQGAGRLAAILVGCVVLPVSGCNCGSSSAIGRVKTAIAVDPNRLDLGQVPLGVRVQSAITVKSAGDAMLTITDIRLVGDGTFKVSKMPALSLPPSVSDQLKIEAMPMTTGVLTATVVIRSNAPNTVELHIPMRMEAVSDPTCDDGNPCTHDEFNVATNACTHSFADGVACTPADRCIVGAVCSQGLCLGKEKVCDDHSSCTTDLCEQSTGECVFTATPTACDDGNPCTADSCGATGCVHEMLPSGAPCDDGNACTVGDACFAGTCRGSQVGDGNACDDGDSCTIEDKCSAGKCQGTSLITRAAEGDVVFTYHLVSWPNAFLHRRQVSLSDDGTFYGLDHLPLTNPSGLTHVVTAFKQCGTDVFQFAYRPPDNQVLVRFVRREIQLTPDDVLRVVIGVRQLPEDGYEPQTTTYLLDPGGNVQLSQIQVEGGETGRALLPDGSNVFGVVWPLTSGPPTASNPPQQNLVVVRSDRSGNVLWKHERSSTTDWAEFLGVAGPRVLFWASGNFGALDFNTGNTVWTQPTQQITQEMALSTSLGIGVARANDQLIGVEFLQGRQIFMFPATEDPTYVPRTDPVISADGRILVMMQRNTADQTQALGLDWVELAADGTLLSKTPLPYMFPLDETLATSEDDPYPTVADDGIAYVGYGNQFWAIDPGGRIRWTLTSSVPNAFTGTVPLLRDDGVMLISEDERLIRGIRTNGGKMSSAGWASFRHDRRRTNFTP